MWLANHTSQQKGLLKICGIFLDFLNEPRGNPATRLILSDRNGEVKMKTLFYILSGLIILMFSYGVIKTLIDEIKEAIFHKQWSMLYIIVFFVFGVITCISGLIYFSSYVN